MLRFLCTILDYIKRLFSKKRENTAKTNIEIVKKQEQTCVEISESQDKTDTSVSVFDNDDLETKSKIMSIAKKNVEDNTDEDYIFLLEKESDSRYSYIIQNILISKLHLTQKFNNKEVLVIDYFLSVYQELGQRMLKTFFNKIAWSQFSVYLVRKNLTDQPTKRIIVKGISGDAGGMLVLDKFMMVKTTGSDVVPEKYDLGESALKLNNKKNE